MWQFLCSFPEVREVAVTPAVDLIRRLVNDLLGRYSDFMIVCHRSQFTARGRAHSSRFATHFLADGHSRPVPQILAAR